MQAFLESPLESLLRVSPLLTLLAAAWVMERSAERAAPRFGVSRVVTAGLTPAVILTALVAGRLVTVISHWRIVLVHPLDLLRINGQVSVFGLGLGAVAALSVLTWRNQLSFPRIADLYGTVVPLAFATYDVSCLVRNDCFGREAPAPLGIRFPGLAIPRYPVELYAAAAALLTYWVLCIVARSAELYPGRVALSALAILGASHALLDPLRLHAEQTAPSLNQTLSLGVTALAVLGLIGLRVTRRGRAPKVDRQPFPAAAESPLDRAHPGPDVRFRSIR